MSFFALRLPMLFVPHNNEELRDFDHYVRSSEGETAVIDYVWTYGPLTPLTHGFAMKWLPHKLVWLRLLSLFIWAVGVFFVARLLSVCLKSPRAIGLGTLCTTFVIGYPSYCHNHVVAAVATIAAAYFLTAYLKAPTSSALFLSFASVAVCLFCRPILMGYGVLAAWSLVYFALIKVPWRVRLQHALIGLGFLSICFFLLYLVYGSSLVHCFVPRKWVVLFSKAYPNLRILFPRYFFESGSWTLLFKEIRAGLETGWFYFHYFVWPTVLVTLFWLNPKPFSLKIALVCALFSLAASADLLHYGFTDPLMEQALTIRGQFFMTLSFCSFYFVFANHVQHVGWKRASSCVGGILLIAMSAWGLGSWIAGVRHISAGKLNPYGFPVLQGVYADSARESVMKAIHSINQRCNPSDYVLFYDYSPGYNRLLKCQDLFEKDPYVFNRGDGYRFVMGENPYIPTGGMKPMEVVHSRTLALPPRYHLMMPGQNPFCPPGDCQCSPLEGTAFRLCRNLTNS